VLKAGFQILGHGTARNSKDRTDIGYSSSSSFLQSQKRVMLLSFHARTKMEADEDIPISLIREIEH